MTTPPEHELAVVVTEPIPVRLQPDRVEVWTVVWHPDADADGQTICVTVSVTTAPEQEDEKDVEDAEDEDGVVLSVGSSGSLLLSFGSSGSLWPIFPLSLTGGHFPSGISMLIIGTLIFMHPPRWKSGNLGKDICIFGTLGTLK